jgi:hypothetical protein
MWTSASVDGRIVERYVEFPLQLKWGYWTTSRAHDFSIEATRLDGPGTFISGDFNPGFAGGSGTPVWVGGPSFSDAGCWRITARLGDHSLTVVVFLQALP